MCFMVGIKSTNVLKCLCISGINIIKVNKYWSDYFFLYIYNLCISAPFDFTTPFDILEIW